MMAVTAEEEELLSSWRAIREEHGDATRVLIFGASDEVATFAEDMLHMAERAAALPFSGALLGFVVKRADRSGIRQRQYEFFHQWLDSMLGADETDDRATDEMNTLWQ